ARRDGEPPRRPVGSGRARLAGRARAARGGAAPLRQVRAAPRPEDGPPGRARSDGRRRARARARRAPGLRRPEGACPVKVLLAGATRFPGAGSAGRLPSPGNEVTLSNGGRAAAAFGTRGERLRGARTTADFEQHLRGRSFDAAVDFAAFTGDDARRVV